MRKIVNGILKNRDTSLELLEPYTKEEFPKYEYINMDKAVKQYVENVNNNKKIGILFDVDVDGLSAGKIIKEYTNMLGLYPEYMMNSDKEHGMNDNVMAWIREKEIEYFIIVDAGTHNTEYYEILNSEGVHVLVLDHHNTEGLEILENNNGTKGTVIVNCNYEGSPNKHLSGAGVVYKFVEKVDKELHTGKIERFEMWVGLTVMSDSCNIIDRENRYYVKNLFENYMEDPLFSKFRNYGSLETMFNFTIIPLLNSCIRMGETELAIELVTTRHDKKIESLIEEANEVRVSQAELVSKALDEIKKLESNYTVMCTLGSLEYLKIKGLVANKIRNTTGKATIVAIKSGEDYLGSFRGTDGITKQTLEKEGMRLAGHDKAAGVFLNVENFKDNVKSFTSIKEDYFDEIPYEYELDFVDYEKHRNVLWSIAQLNELSGNGFEKIKVKIGNIDRVPVVKKFDKVIRYDYLRFELVEFDMTRDTEEDKLMKEIIVHPVLRAGSFTVVRVE